MTKWLAPELDSIKKGRKIFESTMADVFAFGMLAVEVLTGNVPLNRPEEDVVHLTQSGTRPETEGGLTNVQQNIIRRCWNNDGSKRPTMEDVVANWKEAVEPSKSVTQNEFLIQVLISIRNQGGMSLFLVSQNLYAHLTSHR
jgi:hypothetical protein